MSWIQTVGDDEASGQLAGIFQQIRSRTGGVANILRVHSLNPPALASHLGLYQALMFAESPLSRRRREMVAVWVSYLNGCRY